MRLFQGKRGLIAALSFFSFFSSGCLVRRRVVAPPGQRAPKPLLVATKEQLIEKLYSISDPIQSFFMKTVMSPSVGGLYGGQVTDYPAINGFIFFLKPKDIRVVALDPVIHTTAFDMVSTGVDFRASIPSRSEFIVGRNDAPAASANKLENLRPAAFLTSLLVEPPDAKLDTTVLEDDTDESKATYILMMIRRDGDQYYLNRSVYFDRYTLQINRQKTFSRSGETISATKYSEWNDHKGIPFPGTIDITRPKDGYEIVLKVTGIDINPTNVTPAKFILNQPSGYVLKRLQ